MSTIAHPEEAHFKENNPWSKIGIDIVVPFYNEQDNLAATHAINKRLERLFEIKNYIYINNGSKDATGERLNHLASSDPKVKVVDVAVNQGYGHGLQQGFKVTSADYIMTNHADVQFEPYSFFLTHMDTLSKLSKPQPIFPVRANRPIMDGLISQGLRFIISLLTRKKVGDFNGQPKLFPRARVMEQVDRMPKDFALDLAVYLQFENSEVLALPILQKIRLHGESSWNRNPFARIEQIKRWLKAAWSFRCGIFATVFPRQ